MKRILLGTVLLEPNRWKNRECPRLRVSEWAGRAAEAGFDGLELWENHWFRAAEEERAALTTPPLPVSVFNTYARFDIPGDSAGVEAALAATKHLGARALKFNVGPAPGDPDHARSTLIAAARELAPGARLRCECHPGTWLETPGEAASFFESLPVPVDVIVHAFALAPLALAEWFGHLGSRIAGVHVQCRDEAGGWSGIARHPARSQETLRVLEDHGFAGDFTLEFTKGTASGGNEPDLLWASAMEDLHWLRSSPAKILNHRAAGGSVR